MKSLAEVKHRNDGQSVLTSTLDFLRGNLNTREFQSRWDWGSLHFASYPPKAVRNADTTFLRLFRSFVEAWVDSGINEAGIEQPLERKLGLVPKGESESLLQIVQEWFQRYTPHLVIFNDGSTLSFNREPLLENGFTPETYAREMAIYHFKQLLDNSSRDRLARCANPACPAPYFVRKRGPRKLIKCGVYCEACPAKGAAKRTRLSRVQRREKLLNTAATVWQEWKPGRKKDTQKAFVASKLRPVCKELSIQEITVKWVSQNREEIVKRVEERCNGKS